MIASLYMTVSSIKHKCADAEGGTVGPDHPLPLKNKK